MELSQGSESVPRRRASDRPADLERVQHEVRTNIARATDAVAHSRALTESRAADRAATTEFAARLQTSEARFRALVEVAGHVTWVLDAQARIVAPQPAWQAFTGQSFTDARGRDGYGWADAIHPDDRAEALRTCREAIGRGAARYEHRARIRRADRGGGHEWRHTLVRMVPVRGADGAVCEWVGANIDITDLVAAEAAAHTALTEAQAARAAAEAATAAKGRVLAAASHDLRAPLAAIAGYVELLADGVMGPITEAQREALERIDIAQAVLLALTTDIVHAARAEAVADVPLTLSDVRLDPLCDILGMLIAPHVASKALRYDCRIGGADAHAHDDDGTGPLVVYADAERVLQILVNLVGNAIKFSPRAGTVTVDAAGGGPAVHVRVCDTGCGILASQHEAIFQPFVRVGSGASYTDGVGLGLATSRDLARRMGGDITVESTLGVGSVFTLTLPRGRAGRSAPAAGPDQ
ncbi:PAS sensor protein (plasmid) [Gemmatirosa kalamazoonensis]|uniref:histidine kinase n=1 Tax=Gemmatirosa kalamazoonensis TaxID=861299 RepID=W0RPN0_9BACT|nr:PAS sensor protein [Gemmatirosa kalamazoonensis]